MGETREAHPFFYCIMSEKKKIARIETAQGTFFVDNERDTKMAKALESGIYPHERLFKLARTFVNKKSIVIDAGAHIGTFAIPIASKVGKVIAFEPSIEAFTLLSRNVQENRVSIRAVHKALGNKTGSGTLVVRNTSNAGANTLIEGGDIPITTLDSEVAHADLIKIDVEGMELDVLIGGSKLIERARPVVLFEVNVSQLRAHGTSPRELERFFTERTYRLYFLIEQTNKLARVRSTTLLTALIAPRAWLLFDESAPFDLVAIPQERALPFPRASFIAALAHVLKNNLLVKI